MLLYYIKYHKKWEIEKGVEFDMKAQNICSWY